VSITYISAELRRLIVTRADRLCEYCLIAEDDTFYGGAIDHIISEKHGGPTTAENLSYACVFCNQAKGSDVGTVNWATGELVRFFNPRSDRWYEHFELVGQRIHGLTDIGIATVNMLGFNSTERISERRILQTIARYPSDAAFQRMHA